MKTTLRLKQIILFLFLIPCLGLSYGLPTYNAHDSQALKNFANQNSNATLLGIFNPNDMNLYSFATWVINSKNSEYRLSAVRLNNLNTTGKLDLSNCDSLKVVDCENNLNSSLNLDHDYSLLTSNLKHNTFQSFSAIGASKLRLLDISYNPNLVQGDFNNLPSLLSLSAGNTNLNSLELSNDTSLVTLDFSNDLALSSVDLSNLSNLTTVTGVQNNITSFIFGSNPKLEYLSLNNSDALEQIDLSNLPRLHELHIGADSNLISIKLANDTTLAIIDLSHNKSLTSINLSGLTNLWKIYGNNNYSLDTIIFTGDLNLKYIDLSYNYTLKELDLRSCPAITTLYLSNCQFDNFPIMALNSNASIQVGDISANKLPLSQIGIAWRKVQTGRSFLYAPQNPIILKELILRNQSEYRLNADENPIIDLSSEVAPLGNQTNFIWHKIHNGRESIVQIASPSPGIFNIAESNIPYGDSLFVEMKNIDFPLMTLSSCSRSVLFTVANSANTEQNLEQEALHIYPNPCQSSLNIDKSGSYHWSIYNRLGSVVLKGQGENAQQISFNLPAGIYFLKVSNAKKAPTTAKFIVIN